MPGKARGSVAKASAEDAGEYQSLCERIGALEGHRSRDVLCALDMELHSRPHLSIRRISILAPVSETTINGWIKDASSPTWELICGLARDLHPQSPLGDPLVWLQAGREHLQSLIDRRDEMARARHQAAVAAALREELNATSTAEAMLAVVRDLPAPVLEELIERIAAVLAGEEGAEEMPEESN